MISIVVPLYNKACHVQPTMEALLAQTYDDFELIIVNDGSTDNSLEVVSAYKDKRIRIVTQPNSGVSVARNRGIKEAKSDIIAFCDADDLWEPNHLEVINSLATKYPECGVFATAYHFIKDGKDMLPRLCCDFEFAGEDGLLDNYYIMSSGIDMPLHMSAYAARKEHLMQIGGFLPGLCAAEDLLVLAKLFAICDFAYSKKDTAKYVLNTEGVGARNVPIDALAEQFDKLLVDAAHRRGTRAFISSLHRRFMGGYLQTRQWRNAFKEFMYSAKYRPLQTKLYTSLGVNLLKGLTIHIIVNKHH